MDNISKQYPFPAVEHHAPRKYRVRGNVRRSVTGLQALYFRYCYELHILVKHPTSVKRVSFLLKEDVTKLDRLDAQTRLLARNHIRTGEDLSAYQSNVEAAVQALVGKRHELRNELKCVKRRNGVDDAVKAQIKDLTAEIRAKRKEVVLCSEIAKRSEQVREKLERLNKQKKLERKERDEHELFGRRGRTGRENVAGRAEVAAKITGAGAKQVAVLLYAILREQKKTKGKTRLTNMLRSGKELKVFAVKDTDLKQFCEASKKYGVLYCVLKDRNADDGITDVMVRAEDASKINRIFERFQLATVDMGSVKSEIERSRREKAAEEFPEPERSAAESDKTAQLVDSMLQKPDKEQEGHTPNPAQARTTKSPQSEPISRPANEASGISLIENGYGHLYGRN